MDTRSVSDNWARDFVDDAFSHTTLLAAFRSLADRERDVLFGRWSGETLRQVGAHNGVGVERARQIEASALVRLRRHVRATLVAKYEKTSDTCEDL